MAAENAPVYRSFYDAYEDLKKKDDTIPHFGLQIINKVLTKHHAGYGSNHFKPELRPAHAHNTRRKFTPSLDKTGPDHYSSIFQRSAKLPAETTSPGRPGIALAARNRNNGFRAQAGRTGKGKYFNKLIGALRQKNREQPWSRF